MRVLGIDPGSRITGYGVVESSGQGYQYVSSGFIKTQGDTLAERLRMIFLSLQEVVETFSPDEMAIERVFVQKNVDSALKLGQARGAAICSVVNAQIAVFEYSPRQIKQAVVGKGGADKTQVQHMVKLLLNLNHTLQADEADAVACSICHMNMSQTLQHINTVSQKKSIAPTYVGLEQRR